MSIWIQTYTGRRVEPLNLTPDMVCIEDIAHALALQTRYTGHCQEFYSIAQHAVLVSHLVEAFGGDFVTQWWGLHHDDAEAYLGDVARPIKKHTRLRRWDPMISGWHTADFEQVERDAMSAIAVALAAWGEHDRTLVKHCDNLALAIEAPVLITGDLDGWVLPELPEGFVNAVGIAECLPLMIQPVFECFDPRVAKREYLDRHILLTAAIIAARSAA